MSLAKVTNLIAIRMRDQPDVITIALVGKVKVRKSTRMKISMTYFPCILSDYGISR